MNKETMKSVWKKFVHTGETATDLRPDILESWKRCQTMRIDPFNVACPKLLSPGELKKRIQQNEDLLKISRPIALDIFHFISGSEFAIEICDKDGYILERFGDEKTLAWLDASHFWEGASCAEKDVGTNAVGTCLVTGKPMQVCSYEHWSRSSQLASCSASPILGPQKNIIGVLDITGPREKVHPHTLGMTIASTKAIETLLRLKANQEGASLACHHNSLLQDSTGNGLITVDNDGYIIHINERAIKYLGLNLNPAKLHIDTVFKSSSAMQETYKDFLGILECGEKISDEFVSVHFSYGSFKYLGSADDLLENNARIGRTVILQDIPRINKLVNKAAPRQFIVSFSNLASGNALYFESKEIAKQAAKTYTNILILGESGTGKELIAQAIHNASGRENKAFIAVNCSAIPKELLSSELFGYVEGAFTGARKGGAQGKFEAADGGTLFLDEIGDMPLDMQTVLLRVLQERAITRVGDSKTIPADVRIISATNKDLAEEVRLRKFRADLYYRLNVVCIELPALRDRKEDIEMLVHQFVDEISAKTNKRILAIERGFLECCLSYDWPGNIRELKNIVERAIILTTGKTLSHVNFPSELLRKNEKQPVLEAPNENTLLKESNRLYEKSVISKHLEKCQYNKSIVAKQLGISRTTLYRKLKELDL